jgi:hypothetical protein
LLEEVLLDVQVFVEHEAQHGTGIREKTEAVTVTAVSSRGAGVHRQLSPK